MAPAAATKALANAGVPLRRGVGTVQLAALSYLPQTPPAAPTVAHAIGATSAAGLDVDAACAGSCAALGLADALGRGVVPMGTWWWSPRSG